MPNNANTRNNQALRTPRLTLGEVHSQFRINDNAVIRQTKDKSLNVDVGVMPLTSYHGPHSDRISSLLEAHPKLSRFAQGVDERAIYSYDALVSGSDNVYFNYLNNDVPLVFGLYDRVRNCHEVSCVKISQTDQNQFHSEFEIKVFGLLDMGQTADGNYALDYFIDLDEPIVLNYRPEEPTTKTDIGRLTNDSTLPCRELIARLSYLVAVFGEMKTHNDPFCEMDRDWNAICCAPSGSDQ
jgi:hypothetical protein